MLFSETLLVIVELIITPTTRRAFNQLTIALIAKLTYWLNKGSSEF